MPRSYKTYLETRRRHYGLTALGQSEERAKEKRRAKRKETSEERREARLKRANERAMERREAQKRRAAPKPRKTPAKKPAAKRTRAKSDRPSERDYYRYLSAMEDYRRESAMDTYRGWSIDELRSEAVDYGIKDERRDYRKMSRKQLAEWLSDHIYSSQKHYY